MKTFTIIFWLHGWHQDEEREFQAISDAVDYCKKIKEQRRDVTGFDIYEERGFEQVLVFEDKIK